MSYIIICIVRKEFKNEPLMISDRCRNLIDFLIDIFFLNKREIVSLDKFRDYRYVSYFT